jgi:hypothetical protein
MVNMLSSALRVSPASNNWLRLAIACCLSLKSCKAARSPLSTRGGGLNMGEVSAQISQSANAYPHP